MTPKEKAFIQWRKDNNNVKWSLDLRKENGPHLEGAYGSVRTKIFKIVLPKEVDQLGN